MKDKIELELTREEIQAIIVMIMLYISEGKADMEAYSLLEYLRMVIQK